MEPKAGPNSPQSFTQVLNMDNSMLMELDIENIQKSANSGDRQPKVNGNEKRKSNDDDIFKSPSAPTPPVAKKSKPFDLRRKLLLSEFNDNNKVEKKNISMDSEILSNSFYDKLDEIESISKKPSTSRSSDLSDDDKELLLNISGYLSQGPLASQPLTQATDCIKDVQDNKEEFIVTHNPVTSSQYVQSRHEGADSQPLGPPRLLPVSSIIFKNIGPWFGLTTQHKNYLLKTKGIEDLYDWQKECLDLRAIHERKNLIYALPTSGGKTLVAEIAMFREVLLRNKNVMFILPFVSIVQEKIQDLSSFAVEYNFLLEEYCAGKGSIPCQMRRKKNVIYICTIEKGAILLDSLYESKRLNEVGLIVVDELHLLGDPQRGYALELLLTKAINNNFSNIQVIGMSATISNLPEVAEFLKADIYTRDFRPVELAEYAKIGTEIFSINQKALCVSEAFRKLRDCGEGYHEKIVKRDPDHLLELVMEVCPKFSCLIFCATKANCESVAHLLCDLLSSQLRSYKRDEKKNLIEAIKLDLNGRICPTLMKTIPFGVAYHHSGLMVEERRHIEEAYRLGIISVICCTSTLAAGVNLPAKRVIIRSPYVGCNFITLTTYKQMIGRAGRAGKCDSGESIVICSQKDLDKLTDVLCSKMDETVSGFVRDSTGKYLKTAILNLIGLRAAISIDELVELLKPTLFNVQIKKNNEKIRNHIEPQVEQLVNEDVVTVKRTTFGKRVVAFKTLRGLDVYPDDELDVSQLGRAAVNSGMTLKEAKIVEIELKRANRNFTFLMNLNLFYIFVSSDSLESLKINYHECSAIFTSLGGDFADAAKTIGITESLCGRMISRQNSIKESEQLIIKRFYVALIMFDMWNGKEVYEVSHKYNVDRGFVNGILSTASARAFAILKFCEVMEDFWGFKALLQEFTKRLGHCCSAELLPLMELPGVKIGRAKMMYSAGLKSVSDIAVLSVSELCQMIKNVNTMQAGKIIKAAKLSLLEEYDTNYEKAEQVKSIIKSIKAKSSSGRAKL